MLPAWVYIMTSRPNGTFHVGVTVNPMRRRGSIQKAQSRIDEDVRFKRLVYYEEHAAASGALQRRNNVEHWPRAWKARPIPEFNPGWIDLYDTLQ